MRAFGVETGEPWSRLAVEPEALLGAVIEASEDAVVVCDGKGAVVSWGDAATRLFGRPAEAAVGMPSADLFAEHQRNQVVAILARGAAGERIVRFESECLRNDGLPVPVSITILPVSGSDSRTGALVAIVRDETERRLVQATLAEADARLCEGEALSHVGSWLWDLRTNVVQWSVEFHRIHGVDPLEFGGTLEAFLNAVHPSDRRAFRDEIHRSVETGRVFEFEYRSARGRDDFGRILVRAQPLGPPGPVIGVRGVGRGVDQS